MASTTAAKREGIVHKLKRFWSTTDRPTVKTDDTHLKWRGHVSCIALGVLIAIVAGFISSDLFLHYLAPMAGATPSVLQEAWDRIFNL